MIGGGLLLVSSDEHRHPGSGYRGDPRGRRHKFGLDTLPQVWGLGGVDVSGGLGATPGAYTTKREKTWGETFFGWPAHRGGSDPNRMMLPLPTGAAPILESLPSRLLPLPPQRPGGMLLHVPPPGRPGEFGAGSKTIPGEVVSLPDKGTPTDPKAAERIDPSGQLQSQGNTLDRAAQAIAPAGNGGSR